MKHWVTLKEKYFSIRSWFHRQRLSNCTFSLVCSQRRDEMSPNHQFKLYFQRVRQLPTFPPCFPWIFLHEWDRNKKKKFLYFFCGFLAPKPHNRCVDVDLQSESEEQNESIALI